MGSKLIDRMGCSLSWTWHYDLLACGEKIHVCLFASHELFLLGSFGYAGSSPATWHRQRHTAKFCGYARSKRSGLCFLPSAGFSTDAAFQQYRLPKPFPSGIGGDRFISEFGTCFGRSYQMGFNQEAISSNDEICHSPSSWDS